MDRIKPSFGLGMIVALLALVLDRLSKWWIIDIVELPRIQTVKILPIFNLQWAENRGVSFSFLSAEGDLGRWALVCATALIVVFFALWLKNVQSKLLAVAIGLVIGGAIGNIYDRAVFGYVADFLHFFMGDWSFAIFNIADSCITIGAGLLIWDSFFGATSKKRHSH